MSIVATGKFEAVNGILYDPDGHLFIAAGLNVDGTVTNSTVANTLFKLFPDTNYIRVALNSYDDPNTWTGFINTATAKKILCVVEHHPWPLINALSGGDLITENGWYTNWANSYKTNPYVAFASMNEPQGGNISAQQIATYNIIRAINQNCLILFEAGVGAGNPGQTGATVLNSNSYASMRRVAWDLHYYGWAPKFSTDQTTVNNTLMGSASSGTGIAAIQAIKSADGVMPVIVSEFGPSTTGQSKDVNADQVIFAVSNWAVNNGHSSGFAGWHWEADPNNAVQVNGNLTYWGNQLAAAHAAVKKMLGTTQPPVTTTAPPGTTQPPNNAKSPPPPNTNATAGGWQPKQLKSGSVLRSGQHMFYTVLYPANYDPTKYKYPIILHVHENAEGNQRYQGNNSDYLPVGSQADKWYNNSAWRNKYPWFVVLPYIDQISDPSGQTSNAGGYGDQPGSDPNEQSLVTIIKEIAASESIDMGRIYATGNSLGGISAWALALDYNSQNGTVDKIFTAFLPFAGVIERSAGLSSDIINRMRNVPVFAVSGINDTTSKIQDWNRPFWDAMCSANQKGNYPDKPGAQADSSAFHYLEDKSLGHDVWDTYRPLPTGQFLYDWLATQTSKGVTTMPPTTGTASPDNTVIKGTKGTITDNSGNTWQINSAGQIVINGIVDTATANVVELALVSGTIWQENNNSLWWAKNSPSDTWNPSPGTATSPIKITPVPTTAPPTTTHPPVTTAPPGAVSKASLSAKLDQATALINSIKTDLAAL